MNFIGNIQKFSTIKKLPQPQEGDLAFCEERNEYYVYVDAETGWKKREIDKRNLAQTTLYEINRNFYLTQKSITDEDILNQKIDLINNYDRKIKNKYYMLLCKEISYFTILKKDLSDPDFASLGDALTQLFIEQNWEIYDIYENETTGAIEMWTRDPNCEEDNDLHCMILFGYDLGVVSFG